MTSFSKAVMWVALAVSAAAPLQAQCITYLSDMDHCPTGFIISNPRFPCRCNGGGAQRTGYLDVINPGVLVTQSGGKLIVSSLIEGSPAAQAGLLVGDEIQRINDEAAPGRLVAAIK